ncbi:hypothetical protein LYNGBM3L_42560 [Moorena producens 3L]|uniref:Uncharacterized protein n=1 Tax=Moorena producens 3L TaxID=489825 RepID=F4XWG9_9CYAN|nr:hypothetical protein LYNGBM3L_42560 [Moorena producens 3L]
MKWCYREEGTGNREQGECGEMGRWGDGEMGRWGDGADFY